MAGIYCAEDLSEERKALVDSLFTASGKVLWLASEQLMDVVTAISGSGPAYFFQLVECLTKAGISAGLSAEQAAFLAHQTAVGAGAMLTKLDETPSELRARVTSPGGTTAAALEAFDKGDRLALLVKEAVEAAINRARELGSAMGIK
jgi:pyrroline-5-carboxylate reductase